MQVKQFAVRIVLVVLACAVAAHAAACASSGDVELVASDHGRQVEVNRGSVIVPPTAYSRAVDGT